MKSWLSITLSLFALGLPGYVNAQPSATLSCGEYVGKGEPVSRAAYKAKMSAEIGTSGYKVTRNNEFAVEELNGITSRDGSIKFIGSGFNAKLPDRRWTFELVAPRSEASSIVASGQMLAPNGEVLRACTLTLLASDVPTTSAASTASPQLARDISDSPKSPTPPLPQSAKTTNYTPSPVQGVSIPTTTVVVESTPLAENSTDQRRSNASNERRETDVSALARSSETPPSVVNANTNPQRTSDPASDAAAAASAPTLPSPPKSEEKQQSAQTLLSAQPNNQPLFGGIKQWFSELFATANSSMWSLLIAFGAVVVGTGIVQGLREKVVVFRDFDDLAISFVPFACCIVAVILALFSSAKIVMWLLVATAVVIQLFVSVTTWRDNPRAVPFAIALAAKTTLSFFFVINLFSFLFPMEKSAASEARVRRDALIWMAVLAPLIFRLVRVKTGRINPMEMGVRRRYSN